MGADGSAKGSMEGFEKVATQPSDVEPAPPTTMELAELMRPLSTTELAYLRRETESPDTTSANSAKEALTIHETLNRVEGQLSRGSEVGRVSTPPEGPTVQDRLLARSTPAKSPRRWEPLPVARIPWKKGSN
jgi:hypothetical protein